MKNKIRLYVVMGYDRHSDVMAKIFSTREMAQKCFDKYCEGIEDNINESRDYCYWGGRDYAEIREVIVDEED